MKQGRVASRTELEPEVVYKFHPIRDGLTILYGRLKLDPFAGLYRSFGESIGQPGNNVKVLHFAGRRKDTPENNFSLNPLSPGLICVFRLRLPFDNRLFVDVLTLMIDRFFFTLDIFFFVALGPNGMTRCRRQSQADQPYN